MSTPVPATPTNMTPTPPDFTDTGIAGSVGAPASASFGSAPAQLATPGGATFDNPNGPYATNATFPLIFTGLQKTSTGLSAVSGDQGATVTVVKTTNAQIANNVITTTMQLTIPSLGVNQTITSTLGLASHDGDTVTDGLSYAVMGTWWQRANQPSNSGTFQNATVFVFGYETPQTAMPTSGTAVFSGGPGSVTATIYKPMNGEIQNAFAEGGATISANFGSGSIAGSFNHMSSGNSQPWNDVSVAGTIAMGTNKFSGTTAATSSPGTPMSLSGSATGHIDGAFYGPAAQNLGAVWSLSDGTGSAIGTVVAGH
jgi:hypothetical protein